MNRRKLFTFLAALPFLGKLAAKPQPPESWKILRSFDARDWASAFMAHINNGMVVDEEGMASWFANALMRGYDEHRWDLQRETNKAGPAIRGAVTRGWCAPENSHKVMDVQLAEAIVREILALSPK